MGRRSFSDVECQRCEHSFDWGLLPLILSPQPAIAPASTLFELKLSNFLFSYYHPSLYPNIFYFASSHPSPLYFNFHRPPSYVVLRPLFSSYAHTTSTSFPGTLRFHPPQLLLLILSLDRLRNLAHTSQHSHLFDLEFIFM